MANEKVSALPSVASSTVDDTIYAIQGGISVKETIGQVLALGFDATILSYTGNPNGFVAGDFKQLLWDTTNNFLWICTTTGTASTAVWKPCIGSATNGQLPIGYDNEAPVLATITGGSGISVTNGPGTIQIDYTGLSGPTVEVTGTSQTMSANTTYITNNAALVSLSLPASAGIGDRIEILGKGAGGWSITQLAGQQIHVGSNASTIGVAGSVSSKNQYDSIILVCTVANTTWTALSAPIGPLNIA